MKALFFLYFLLFSTEIVTIFVEFYAILHEKFTYCYKEFIAC